MSDRAKQSGARHRAAEKRGRYSESLAAALLRLKFYRILGRRVKTRVGEVDIIARSPGGVLCFIEVKLRNVEGRAAESIGTLQRQRIARAAEAYLAAHPRLGEGGIRFDVITLASGSLPRHIQDAWRPE